MITDMCKYRHRTGVCIYSHKLGFCCEALGAPASGAGLPGRTDRGGPAPPELLAAAHRGQARAPHRRSPENHDHCRTPAPSLYCGCTGAAGEASGESRSGSPRPANRPDHVNQLQRPNRDLRHNGRDKASNLLPPPGKGYLACGDRRSCRASQRPGSKATTMCYHEFGQSFLLWI